MAQNVSPDIGAEFVEGMARSAPFTQLINESNYFCGSAPFERDEIMYPLVEQIMGRHVMVTELAAARTPEANRPIQNFISFLDSALGDRRDDPDLRRLQGDSVAYLPANFRQYRRHALGKVIEADLNRQSLVLRPYGPLRFLQRYWIAVVNDEGEPLVELRTLP